MRGFFRDWKRKVGVVALLIACLLLGGWIRSRSIGDFFAFSAGIYPMMTINSRLGTIEFAWHHEFPYKVKPQWSSSAIRTGIGNTSAKDSFMYEWGIAEITSAGKVLARGTSLTVHFWALVLPPGLLSAYLLLSKPRVKVPDLESTSIE